MPVVVRFDRNPAEAGRTRGKKDTETALGIVRKHDGALKEDIRAVEHDYPPLAIASEGAIGDLGRRVLTDLEALIGIVLQDRVAHQTGRAAFARDPVGAMLDGESRDGHAAGAVNGHDAFKNGSRFEATAPVENRAALPVERQPVCGNGHPFFTGSRDSNRIAWSGVLQCLRDRSSSVTIHLQGPRQGRTGYCHDHHQN